MSSTITTYLLSNFTLELSADFSELIVREKSTGATEATYPTDPGISVAVNPDATGDAYVIKAESCGSCFPFHYSLAPVDGHASTLSFNGAKMIGVGVVRIEDSGLRTIEFLLDKDPVYLNLGGSNLTVKVSALPDGSPDETCFNILP